jgi:hypothetical protein
MVGVSTSTHVAGRSICATVAIGTPLVAGRPATVADTFYALASCCPPVGAVAVADDACPPTLLHWPMEGDALLWCQCQGEPKSTHATGNTNIRPWQDPTKAKG